MKKFLSAVLTLALLLSLGGCGGTTDTKVPETNETAEPSEAAVYAESFVDVENIVYQLYDHSWELDQFNVNIRNVTDNVMNEILLFGQALDTNGDVLEEWAICYADALEPGQASWLRANNSDVLRDCKSIEEAAQRADSIRIIRMGYRAVTDAEEDWMGWEEYDFKEPPTFKVAGIRSEEEEGNALTIENVSVEFVEQLPQDLSDQVAYYYSGEKTEWELDESMVYAAVHFTVTNQYTEEIKLSDTAEKFIVELVYDGGYTYASGGTGFIFYQSGSQYAMVRDGNFSISKVVVAPLLTEEVTVYVPCAKAVAENEDKTLDINFLSLFAGHEKMSVSIR